MYRKLRRWGVRLLCLLLAGSLMGAYCGRKDDLYLPKEKPQPPAKQSATPPPASSASAPAAEPPPAPSTKSN